MLQLKSWRAAGVAAGCFGRSCRSVAPSTTRTRIPELEKNFSASNMCKKTGLLSLFACVILSAGAMLIFSVLFQIDQMSRRTSDANDKTKYVPRFYCSRVKSEKSRRNDTSPFTCTRTFLPQQTCPERLHHAPTAPAVRHPPSMHSSLVRIQNVFGFFTSVAFAVAAAIAVSVVLSPQTPSAKLELRNVQVYVSQNQPQNPQTDEQQRQGPPALLQHQARGIRTREVRSRRW